MAAGLSYNIRFSSIFICRHHGKTQNPRENHRRRGQLPGHDGLDRGLRRASPHRHRGTGLDSLKPRRTGAPGGLRTPPQSRNRAHPGLRPLRSGHPAPPGAFFCPILRTCITHRYAGRAPNPSRWTIPGGFCQMLRKCYEIVPFCPNFVPLLRIIRRKAGPAGQVTGRSGGELGTRPCTGENFLSLYCNSFSRSDGPFFT